MSRMLKGGGGVQCACMSRDDENDEPYSVLNSSRGPDDHENLNCENKQQEVRVSAKPFSSFHPPGEEPQ